MRLLASTCFAASAAFVSAVSAACPMEPADAIAGIEVRYSDGTRAVVTDLGDGRFMEDTRYEDGTDEGFLVLSMYGLYSVEEYSTTGGEFDNYYFEFMEYPVALEDLPQPRAGLVWRDVLLGLDEFGEFERLSTLTIGQPEEVRYGECSYSSLPATVQWVDDGLYDMAFGFDYIPALKIAIYHSTSDLVEQLEPERPISITALGG